MVKSLSQLKKEVEMLEKRGNVLQKLKEEKDKNDKVRRNLEFRISELKKKTSKGAMLKSKLSSLAQRSKPLAKRVGPLARRVKKSLDRASRKF